MNYEEEIEERLTRLRSRHGFNAHLQNLTFASKDLAKDKTSIVEAINGYRTILPQIKILLKEYKKHVPPLWGKTPEVASYLILGKVYSNISSLFLLAEDGRCWEVMEIARSGMESLDLVFLFLEDESQTHLDKWFAGRIISNEHGREQLHASMNNNLPELSDDGQALPIKDMKAEMYQVYSAYTHSCYVPLLDSIDPFREDLDFEGNAGFHFTLENMHVIKTLIVYMVQQLKYCFLKTKDLENYKLTCALYDSLNVTDPTPEEIAKVLDRHRPSTNK